MDNFEEVEAEDEDEDLMLSEYIGIDFKSRKLIREGASSLSWLVTPKDYEYDITEDLESMKVPFKKFDYRDDGVHLEIDKAHVSQFLETAFTVEYYSLFTVHLDQDEDDILPESRN